MDGPETNNQPTKSRRNQFLQIALSLAVVILIFGFAFPKLADYSEVWDEIAEMTWLELATIGIAAVWNIVTYWFVMVASLPDSNYWQAMKINQTSTAVANTLPGGGAIGIGVTYGMYLQSGFTRSEIGLSILVTGIWNNFVKLGMPIIALALLAIQGDASAGLVTAALIGMGVLAGAVVLFALVLKSDRFARSIGERLGTILSWLRKLVRKPAIAGMGESVVRFREEVIVLLRRRWLWLTLATIVSHLSLYLVLLLSLRHVGVSEAEVSWAQVLAAFSFVRLISAIPITPGGLGVVELGLTAALIAAGGDEAEVAAAVLLYRALTYLPPIAIGAVLYLKWRKGSAARKERVAEAREAGVSEVDARIAVKADD